MKSVGMVYLVGAGPGDMGLFTLRGAELLARADVVVYDALVNRDLLRLAPPEAEFIYGGKRAQDHAIPQEEMNRLLVAKAREGKRVVRLKGGDPYIFGRGGEEAEELAQADIPFEVVPGISSISAAPCYAGIPITHRDHCSSFTVLTGHEDPTKEDTSLDYALLAKTPGTKVVLMGVERIGFIAQALIEHGLDASTPVGMVRWGTTGQQQTLEATLGTVAERVRQSGFKAPAVTVIGDVVKLRPRLNWFESRPLFGQRIVVTRTRAQASRLSKSLAELGADILEIPTIRVVPPDDLAPLKDALVGLNAYDWLVFTSPNGVDAFFEYFFKGFEDMRDLGGVRIAAVGPGTAARLQALHLKVDVMPEKALTTEIPAALAAFESIENRSICLLRAQKGNPELPKALHALGVIVDDIPVYQTVLETEDRNGAAARFEESGCDWITFTSSSTVENFHARFDLNKVTERLSGLKLASIGPETSKAILQLGLKPTLEAKVHTIDGLVAALAEWE